MKEKNVVVFLLLLKLESVSAMNFTVGGKAGCNDLQVIKAWNLLEHRKKQISKLKNVIVFIINTKSSGENRVYLYVAFSHHLQHFKFTLQAFWSWGDQLL